MDWMVYIFSYCQIIDGGIYAVDVFLQHLIEVVLSGVFFNFGLCFICLYLLSLYGHLDGQGMCVDCHVAVPAGYLRGLLHY